MTTNNTSKIGHNLTIGKGSYENTSHLLYDRMPEWHPLAPVVTLPRRRGK